MTTRRGLGFTAGQAPWGEPPPASVGMISELAGGEQVRPSRADYLLAAAQGARDVGIAVAALGIAVAALVVAWRFLRRGAK